MRILRALTLIVAVLTVLALPSTAAAQTQNGRIAGVVTDESGAVLPGATVTLKGVGAAVRTAATDATGHYVIADVAPGTYDLTIEMSGFKPQASKVTVAADQTVNLEAKLPDRRADRSRSR